MAAQKRAFLKNAPWVTAPAQGLKAAVPLQ